MSVEGIVSTFLKTRYARCCTIGLVVFGVMVRPRTVLWTLGVMGALAAVLALLAYVYRVSALRVAHATTVMRVSGTRAP